MAEVYFKKDAKISIPDSAFEYAQRMNEKEKRAIQEKTSR